MKSTSKAVLAALDTVAVIKHHNQATYRGTFILDYSSGELEAITVAAAGSQSGKLKVIYQTYVLCCKIFDYIV